MPDELGLEEPKLVLPPGVYDKMKLSAQVIVPGISSLYFGLAQIWGWPNAEQVVGTLALLAVFLGSLVAISSKRYNNSDAKFDGVVIPQVDGGGLRAASMELKGDPEVMLQEQGELRFKVLPPQP